MHRRLYQGGVVVCRAMPTGPRGRPLTVVLSMGGSVLVTGEDDVGFLARLAKQLARIGRRVPLIVTTGGGRTARDYIRLGRLLGLTEVELDEIGIDVTRLHARLLAAQIGPPTPAHVPSTVAQAVHELQRASPVVLGGTEPGHTTDGVAALLAVRLKASRVVNATSVDGFYDRDPRRHANARRLDRVGWEEFRTRVNSESRSEAGQEFVFDRLGADLLARSGIPMAIVHGRNLPNLEAALLGRRFVGTRVG